MRSRWEALKTVPTKLDDAFLDTIRRIESHPLSIKEQGMNTLSWVFLAERQLKIEELRCALSVKPGDTHVDEEEFPTCKSLLDCYFSLVFVDDSTSSVRLVHKSLQDFFERQHTMLLRGGQQYIARTCLTYMGFDHDLGTKYHLHSYVNKYWGHHHFRNRPDCTGLEKGQIFSSLRKFDASLDEAREMPPWLADCSFKRRKGLKSSDVFWINRPYSVHARKWRCKSRSHILSSWFS
ncbi:Similar to hypothetical protein AOR_1_934164 [Aspergillus oryzae RIB40]; acc. no. XP_001819039 [Pyronema omphalodes CBS 100304]|uniref:GPI inositol-deacylase winged helix domain-containing protein n=1 Tax=Pyronema omphalodes (strain CBS 100304) TaxID=1076935 RepID=U4L2R5_PYROM|nr:Similar to hypothetical protein AOR_1_934164 [Aspergillus oryzae RIB40]; acc. no. XP_001819039 [Pyronema omphalodes CBS 100304]